MADDNSVEVQLVGVDDGASAVLEQLRARLAVSDASFRTLSSSVKATAEDIRGLGDDTGIGMAGLGSLASGARAAKAESLSLAAQIKALETTGMSMGAHLAANIPTATREFRALFDEVSSGRTRMLPGTLAILAQRVLGLGPAALLAGGSIAALVGGLGYLAYRSIEAAEAVEQLSGVAAFDNLDIADDQIAKFVDQIHGFAGASRQDTQEATRAFMGMKNATVPLIQAMTDQLQLYVAATGEKIPEAAKKMAEAFGDPLAKGEAFLRGIHADRDAIQQFDAAAQRGDAVGALITMMTTLAEATQRLQEKTHVATESQRTMATVAGEMTSVFQQEAGAADAAATSIGNIATNIAKIDTAKLRQLAQDITAATSAAKDFYAQRPTGAPLADVSEEIEAQKVKMQLAGKTNAEIAAMERDTWAKRVAIGDLSGKELTKAQMDAGKATIKANEESFKNWKDVEDEKVEAAKSGSAKRIALLREEQAEARSRGFPDKANEIGKQIAENQREGATQGVKSAKEAAEEQFRILQDETEKAKAGSQDRINAALKELAYAKQTFGEGSSQWKAAELAKTEATNEQSARRAQIARATEQANVEIATKSMAAAKDALNSEFTAHEITAAQEYAQLKTFADEKYQLDLKVLNDEISTLEAGTAEYQKAVEQRRVLAAQLTLDQSALLHQFTEQTKQELAQQTEAYKSAFKEIDGTIKSFFDDWASRQDTAAQAALKAIQKFDLQFISDLAEMALKFAAFEAAQAIGWKQIAAGIAGGDKVGGVGGMVGGLLGLSTPQSAASAASTAQFATAVTLFQNAVLMMRGGQAMPMTQGGPFGGAPASDLGGGSLGGSAGSQSIVEQLIAKFTSLGSIFQTGTSATQVATAATQAATVAQTAAAAAVDVNTVTGQVVNTTTTAANTVAVAANTAALAAESASSGASGAGSLLKMIPIIGQLFPSMSPMSGLRLPSLSSPGNFQMPAGAFAGAGGGGDMHFHGPLIGQIISRRPGDIKSEFASNINSLAPIMRKALNGGRPERP